MDKKFAFRIAIFIAALAVVAPVVLSIWLARREAASVEFARVAAYARDVVNRTDSTADQVAAGVARLVAADAAPCSDAELAMMREIDLASSYIQTIGRVSGDAVQCSSLGADVRGFVLGPVDIVSKQGVAIHTDVRFAFTGDAEFLVLELDGFAAVIHKALPIDVTTQESDVALATFLQADSRLLTSRGHVDPAWLSRPRTDGVARFVDDGYIVTVMASHKYDSGAVAAVSETYLDRRMRRVAMVLLPIGLVAGLALAAVIGYLARQQTAMPAAIRTALRRNEFFVQYQPIVELATGRWVGAEALARWRRSSGEMVRPDLFIPVAEESGLIGQITERILALVTPDMATLVARGLDVHVSVNLASADLHTDQTLSLLQKVLRDSGSKASNLHVEATERGFMKMDVARKLLDEIRALGIRVAIDDFGTGYSSLSYLESFRLDYLKIDKSFVDTVGSEAATSQVVPHIIEMAKSLKLEMIAEGVETQSQADFLRESGVRYAQGWLFSRPLPFEVLLEGLLERNECP